MRDSLPLHPIPTLTALEDLCPIHDGPCPRTASRRESASFIRYRQNTTEGDTTCLNGSNNGHTTGPATASSTERQRGTTPTTAIVDEHELLWDGLSPAVTNALGQPIDPALVSQRKGRAGRTFSYIEGHVAISEANRVFGYGGWGYELLADVTLREIENVDPQTGEVKRIRAYSAPVRVTVPGAPPRTDVGFHAVTEETADGHETALKGAVTDGIKRALRSFGDRFGNGLYGDQAPVGGPPRPDRAPAQARAVSAPANVATLRKRLVELAAEQGFDEDQVRTAVVDRLGKSLDDLTAAELTPLIEGATEKLQQMRQAQAA